jgi:hypothetical protein
MILKISQKMGENFRKMEMFPLPFMGILPIEIQYNIIVESERNWYNDSVNKIIDAWYLFIKRKIDITNLASNFKREIKYTNNEDYCQYMGTEGNCNIRWYINPYKIEKNLEYIEKIFTGTEDITFWESRLEGLARGILFVDCKESSWDFLKNEKIKGILKKIRNKIVRRNEGVMIQDLRTFTYLFAPTFMRI